MEFHCEFTGADKVLAPALAPRRRRITSLMLVLVLHIFGAYAIADFEDVSTAVGLEDDDKKKAFGNPTWVDFNKDGHLDMVSSRHRYDMNVYLNNGDGTFTNLFEESGLYPTETWDHHGFAWADFNNDGHWDLFVAEGAFSGSLDNASQLWFGDGTGKFENKTAGSGLIGTGRTALAADINSDGLVDILKVDPGVALFLNNGNGTFQDTTSPAGLDFLNEKYYLTGSFADYDFDGDMDFVVGGGPKAVLMQNDGHGNFTEVYTFGLTNSVHTYAWADYDNDGDLDVGFGMGKADYAAGLQVGSSTLHFADRTLLFQIGSLDFTTTGGDVEFFFASEYPASSTNIFIGKTQQNPPGNPFTISEAAGEPTINRFKPDTRFFVWSDEGTNNWHVRWTSGTAIGTGYGAITVSDGEEILDVSTSYEPDSTDWSIEIYRNEGGGVFTPVSEEIGTIHIGNHKAGLVWGDYDNDRDLDLYSVDNGTIAGNRPNALFQNNGSGIFTDVAAIENVAAMQAVGRHYGSSWGDYDNDGFLDLFLSQGFGYGTPLSLGKEILYRNLEKENGNTNHSIQIHLEGVLSNRAGIGASIEIATAQGTQYRHFNGGSGGQLYSQSAAPIHAGLGSDSMMDSLKIRWPSGIVQELFDIPASQKITVVEKVSPDPFGQPSYKGGKVEGVFLWKDQSDGTWHLRTSGAGAQTDFSIKLVSSMAIAADPYGLEASDEWSSHTYGFTLKSKVSTWIDGVDFTIPEGAKVLISVEQDGIPANPRLLRVGTGNLPLTPAGWILPSLELPINPAFSGSVDAGLFIGRNSSNDTKIRALMSSPQLTHNVKLHVIAADGISQVTPITLEPQDIVTTTSSSVEFEGLLNDRPDGLNITLGKSTEIGITYEQDSLFQPLLVNPRDGDLGPPNAYWLP